jgi:two-component system response regulator YesN
MKVIIVDDESAVHEQLQKMIPWEELGWEIVGHAYNGVDARWLTQTFGPNLIITDLKMPLMDGISFMEWLKNSEYTAKVIVLSGYGDFEYSRSAFLLNAYDYILKPVNAAELLSTLVKAVEQIHLESDTKANRINEKAILNQGLTLMQDEFISQIVNASLVEENEIFVRAEQLMIALPDNGYVSIIVKFMDIEDGLHRRYEGDRTVFYFAARNIIQETIGHSTAVVYRNLQRTNEFLFLFPCSEKTVNLATSVLRRLHSSLIKGLQVKVKMGISSPKQRITKLSTAYTEATHALESLRLGDDEYIGYYGNTEGQAVISGSVGDLQWKEMGLLLDILLDGGALHAGELLLGKLDEAFQEETLLLMSGSEMKKEVTLLLTKIQLYSTEEQLQLLIKETKIGLEELKIIQVTASLRKIVEALLRSAAGGTKAKSGKQLVEVIKQYMDNHYKTVSLDEVSQRFFLNKNYICSLFKNVTSFSFVEYLTALRMEQAKRLLEVSDLKTYEIANQVGYTDQRYFSQVFRKYTGHQPTQYRLQHREHG